MFLSQPGETPYDLRFQLMGFPVRVHPLFFLLPLLMSGGVIGGGEINVGVGLVVVVSVFFISILVHELGHCLAFRYYGIQSEIVLYLMGGLAVPSGFGSWRGGRSRGSITPWSQIVISAAGPAAGFALAGAFMLCGTLLGGTVRAEIHGLFPAVIVLPTESAVVQSPALWIFLLIGVWINVFWNLLNLMPVFPLDGGQIARQIFVINDPWNGIRNATLLSVLTGGLIAVWGFSSGNSFMGIMFAMLAVSNYQSLAFGGGPGGNPW